MAMHHLTMRLGEETFARLEAQRKRLGQSRSALSRTLLEEGLRMEDHPGIVFRAGPAGRRAGLAAGPDVWEVARVFREARDAGEEGLARAAEACGSEPQQVRTALRYYADYPDEIDDWLRRVDDEAASAEAAWHREQALLRR